jgi:hypothetical protein
MPHKHTSLLGILPGGVHCTGKGEGGNMIKNEGNFYFKKSLFLF